MGSFRGRLVYEFLRRFNSPFAADAPLQKQRNYVERQARLAHLPAGVAVEATGIGSIAAEWLRPRAARDDRLLLYLHGGGYIMGSCATHRALAARIAVAAALPTLLIEYRLAPEDPFPAALDDARAALQALLDKGLDPRHILLAGDSSGGGLAVALAVDMRNRSLGAPGGIVCMSPWTDLTVSGETMFTRAATDPLITREASVVNARRYAGGIDPASPLISPLFADLHGLPPILIQVGEHEVLVSDAERLAANARRDGVPVTLEIWDGMWHVWQAYSGIVPEAQQAIDHLGAFLRAMTNA